MPLAGRRILVTRAREQAGKLSEALLAQGAAPVEVPVLEIAPPADYAPLDAALRQLDQYDWLILTSANTVRFLAERAAVLGISLAGRAPRRVAAVGEATAAAARKTGLILTFVPESYVAESLVEGLLSQCRGQRILLARAEVARDLIPCALREAGAEVEIVEAYRNRLPESAPAELRRALAEGIDAATFTSSSSVTHLAEAAERAGVPFPWPKIPAISIGPITSQSLREASWEPAAEATPSDIPGLVAALVEFFGSR
jgi:uroporphyrinogen-III synthase